MSEPHLVLASGSPRRRELLARDGYAFDIVAADVDECIDSGESPVAATCRLAIEKACAVRERLGDASVILAADTTVALGGRIFGKPSDGEDARHRRRIVFAQLDATPLVGGHADFGGHRQTAPPSEPR